MFIYRVFFGYLYEIVNFTVYFKSYGNLLQFEFWQNVCIFWRKFFVSWSQADVQFVKFRMSVVILFFTLIQFRANWRKGKLTKLLVIIVLQIMSFGCNRPYVSNFRTLYISKMYLYYDQTRVARPNIAFVWGIFWGRSPMKLWKAKAIFDRISRVES